MKAKWLAVLHTELRLLTFRADRAAFEQFDNRHLAFGFLCTWLVGIGRSWDKPKAELLQHLGVGSGVYVFALALLLWFTLKPFAASDSSYRRVLTFVCLASPPGFLYAIPVEQWMPPDVARAVNLVFLVIVAAWRVALLFFYFKKSEGLQGAELTVVTLLPLSIIMGPLTVLHVLVQIMDAMAGVGDGSISPVNSGPSTADNIVALLGLTASVAFLPLLMSHSILSRKAEFRKSYSGKLGNSTRYENPKTGDW